jgi:hypothetical protein
MRTVNNITLCFSPDRKAVASAGAPLRCTLPTRPGDQLEQARLEWDGKGGSMPEVALDEVRLESTNHRKIARPAPTIQRLRSPGTNTGSLRTQRPADVGCPGGC